jgi:hypothetical protein
MISEFVLYSFIYMWLFQLYLRDTEDVAPINRVRSSSLALDDRLPFLGTTKAVLPPVTPPPPNTSPRY